MALDPKLLEILACPQDKGPLWYFTEDEPQFSTRTFIVSSPFAVASFGPGAPS